MEQDFSRRLSIVVRKDIESWQVTNTIAHIAAKVSRAVETFETRPTFQTKDGVTTPTNSQYPIMVFQTEGVEKLRALISEIRKAGLPHLSYVREMIDFENDDDLQAALGQKNEADVEYLGVGVFGDNAVLKQLTKKFSLWK